MDTLSSLLSQLDTKGGEYALNTRNRLRTAYVAAKTYGKNHNWTPADDRAFDSIDAQTLALVNDSGMAPPPPPALPTLSNASEDDFRREAQARGFHLSNMPKAQTRVPAPAPAPAPENLLKVATAAPGHPALPVGYKPEGFA